MSTKGIRRKSLRARLRDNIRRVRRFLWKCLGVRLIKLEVFSKSTLIMVVLLIVGALALGWSNVDIALDYIWTENRSLWRLYWVGCYADWEEERDLPVLAHGESTDLKHCLNLCANYLYLAIQNNMCWCGNEYATRPEHKRLPKHECFNNSENSISPSGVYRTRTNKLEREEPETYVCVEDIYNKKLLSVVWSYRLSIYGSGRFRYVPMTNRQSCRKPSPDRPTVGSVWHRKATVTMAGHELCKKFDSRRTADFMWYWDKTITSKWNSTTSTAYFPLTPRFEFGLITEEERTTSSKRKYAYSFSGALTSPDRVTMADVVPKLSSSKGIIHTIKNWKPSLPKTNSERPEDTQADKYMSAKQYRGLLLDSVFTMCPIGHNPESYRI